MTKRLFDFSGALLGLALLLPFLLLCCLLIWVQDWRSPLYLAPRVRRGGGVFTMVKLRSMTFGADRLGGSSTSADDRRITAVGHFIRRYKLDELAQLCNVLTGAMSLVGPRPQVPDAVAQYADWERRILSVRPGITDFSSIIFADEAEILRGSEDPDRRYDELIRPWKSRLALFYVDHSNLALDLKLCLLTAATIISRRWALGRVSLLLAELGADPALVRLARRDGPLPVFSDESAGDSGQ